MTDTVKITIVRSATPAKGGEPKITEFTWSGDADRDAFIAFCLAELPKQWRIAPTDEEIRQGY